MRQVEIGAGANETPLQATLLTVDSIFSQLLEGGVCMVHFLRALCRLSVGEGKDEPHRTFCLEKVVWFCGYKVAVPVKEWARVWKILGKYFNEVDCM